MTTLTEELTNDPAGLGYAALITAGNDAGIANLLNTATVFVVGEIDRADLATWAASTGMRAMIKTLSEDAGSALQSSALAIVDVLQGAAGGIDLSKPAHMAILDAWKTAGVLSADDKASFIAFATHDVIRSVYLFGNLVSANDVARTVRADDGTPLIGA